MRFQGLSQCAVAARRLGTRREVVVPRTLAGALADGAGEVVAVTGSPVEALVHHHHTVAVADESGVLGGEGSRHPPLDRGVHDLLGQAPAGTLGEGRGAHGRLLRVALPGRPSAHERPAAAGRGRRVALVRRHHLGTAHLHHSDGREKVGPTVQGPGGEVVVFRTGGIV